MEKLENILKIKKEEDEYRRKILAWEHEHKNRIYAFMLETGGMEMV